VYEPASYVNTRKMAVARAMMSPSAVIDASANPNVPPALTNVRVDLQPLPDFRGRHIVDAHADCQGASGTLATRNTGQAHYVVCQRSDDAPVQEAAGVAVGLADPHAKLNQVPAPAGEDGLPRIRDRTLSEVRRKAVGRSRPLLLLGDGHIFARGHRSISSNSSASNDTTPATA
jgi:hypothetical protein